MTLMFILTIVVIVALVGSLPVWPHSKNWSYYPSGGVGAVMLIILILLAGSDGRRNTCLQFTRRSLEA
jgi:low affinity Fe/Cu permease